MDKNSLDKKYKGMSFLKLLDFSSQDIQYFLSLSAQLKAEKKAGVSHRMHEGISLTPHPPPLATTNLFSVFMIFF